MDLKNSQKQASPARKSKMFIKIVIFSGIYFLKGLPKVSLILIINYDECQAFE